MPESRGEFLRGWDHGRGADPGRAVGSWQKGTIASFDTTAGGVGIQAPRASDASADVVSAFGADAVSSALYPGVAESGVPSTAAALGTASVYGSTRPRNLAVMWCIKAWNAPINQGSIDIAALAASVVQATETTQGTAKVATQAQANDGTDDATIVTPKKLRLGFSVSLAVNGYIVFPSWLGGVMLQWGIELMNGTTGTFKYPIAFKTNVYQMLAADSGSGAHSLGVSPSSLTGFTAYGNVATTNFRYLAIGS